MTDVSKGVQCVVELSGPSQPMRLRVLRAAEDQIPLAIFDIPSQSDQLQSRATQVGMAVILACLESVPTAMVPELGRAVQDAENILRNRAQRGPEGKFLLLIHVAAEARRQKSREYLVEADSLLLELLDEKYSPAEEWAQSVWPKLRELTRRTIEQR